MENKVTVNVKLSPEYLKRLDELRANMKAYGRKQVWEECTCKNCKWWDCVHLDEIDDSDNCYPCTNQTVNDAVIVFNCGGFTIGYNPPGKFGCNLWEARDEMPRLRK